MSGLLHCSEVGGGAAGQGLHVRVGEARHLQVGLGLQDVGQAGHQTHGGPGLKQHDAGQHAQLWVLSPVHEYLDRQILNLEFTQRAQMFGKQCLNSKTFFLGGNELKWRLEVLTEVLFTT